MEDGECVGRRERKVKKRKKEKKRTAKRREQRSARRIGYTDRERQGARHQQQGRPGSSVCVRTVSLLALVRGLSSILSHMYLFLSLSTGSRGVKHTHHVSPRPLGS